MQLEDDMLLKQASDGNRQAWQALVERWTPRVYGLLLSRCRDRELAEELTQESFVKLVMTLKKDGYRYDGHFGAWLMRVAMNTLRDEMRRRKRQAMTMDTSPAASASGSGEDHLPSAWAGYEASRNSGSSSGEQPDQQVSRQEQVGLIYAAMAEMSDKDRELLHLRHTAELSFAEIAEVLGQPLGTVLARGHRALAKLRKALEPTLQPQEVRYEHTH